ncbi:discoidin domain-containing protein [Streptomyces griseocarneus]|uniref:discoidin domain-containing protein n=1 Tax=Streptomyces griseocarneus TaxID=51201 RepID=UPI00167F005D|nr:discoidin domain-containing protein [Streptomyces griseocarneus]MBZ6476467.1 discoidin domain-containing protein [Streptomyces griseocarneus]GHG78729.1 kojibiose phosphorylase [Streptomyces griseocarneus]
MTPSPDVRSRPGRLSALLLAGALVASVPPAAAAPASHPPTTDRSSASTSPSPGSCRTGDGWTLETTRASADGTHHAYLGNGYLGQRVPPNGAGYTGTDAKTGWPLFTPSYDGSFVSGLYAHNKETAGDRQAVAALPTWSALTVGTGGEHGDTFNSLTQSDRISGYRQTLFLHCGIVRTSLTWTAADGRKTDLVYEVLADRNDAHVGAVRLSMTPRWSGEATVTDLLDGRGARRIRQTGGGDRTTGTGQGSPTTMDVAFRTDGTDTDGAVASSLSAGPGVRTAKAQKAGAARDLSAQQSLTFPVRKGHAYDLTKYVGVDTALTSRSPRQGATTTSQRAARRGWQTLLRAHTASWARLWRADIEVPGRRELQAWVRSARYGLLSSTRTGAANSIAPAGLTSDNYAGLVFWDAETWMYPALLATSPELARTVVDYRYRTLPGARENARKLGYQGLFYPWNSGSNGDLAQECHSVDPPHCRTQIHLQSDISLAAWQYYLATGDTGWLRERGWPVMKGIAEFWAARVTRNTDGSYSIKDTAGPDEYSNGVDDAVFTNAGAVTALRNAARAAQLLGERAPGEWTAIADRVRIPYDAQRKVFQQYDGYKGSKIKQADTVLLMYPLEWPMPTGAAAGTLDYYAQRTDPDGPAMTDSVHAIAAAGTGEPGCSTYTYLQRSIRPFVRGPFAQFSEARGAKAGAEDPLAGTPAHDFLTGKGGFLQTFTNGLTGMRMREDRLHLDPMLPPQLSHGVTLRGMRWQGRTYDIELGAHRTTVRLTDGAPMTLETPQGKQVLTKAAPAVLETRRPDLTPTNNLARCTTVTASSEEPGLYADAAVDGNPATAWVPDGPKGSLTTDLGKTARIAKVAPTWSGPEPVSYDVQLSADGRHWHAAPAGAAAGSGTPEPARYVRVVVRGDADAISRTGIAELTVS